MALEASLIICGPKGERIIPIEKFFEGFGKTKINTDEIVTRIDVSRKPEKQAFLKLKRVSKDLAKINISASFDYCKKKLTEIRVAVGCVAPKVIRLRKIEKFLEGKMINEAILEEAANIIRNEISPITDIRSTHEYRSEMSKVLLKRVIKTAVKWRVAL